MKSKKDSFNLEQFSLGIVKIITNSGSGSGFYDRHQNLIITNYHVVAGQQQVAIENKEKKKFIATALQVNPFLDLAFLKPAQKLDVPVTRYKKHQLVQNTERVMILGYPYGLPFTITEGIISSTRQLINGQFYIQTDAAINPGNSGGPMITMTGDIIGIATSKFADAENIGFALPADHIIEELRLLRKDPASQYSIKCPSCGFLMTTPQRYCENCGVKLESEALFQENYLSALAQFVEEALVTLKIDPIMCRNGSEFWEFAFGSAKIRIFVFHQDYLVVTSPLVKLPGKNLDKLYSFLLSDPYSPFLLGIDNTIVYLSYRVHHSDIQSVHRDTIFQNIVKFVNLASQLDDELVSSFGCLWTEDTGQIS